MKLTKYLVVNGNGNVKLYASNPRLKQNEIAIALRVEIPDAFFRRPKLEASIVIPEESVPQTNLTTELAANVEKLVKENMQMDIKVSLSEFPEEKK